MICFILLLFRIKCTRSEMSVDGMSEEETRFFGLKRECGLHEGTDTDFAI